MKRNAAAAAGWAARWAAGLSVGFALGPLLLALASGTNLSGEVFAMKLMVGIASFPILFFGLWAWGAFSKMDAPHTASSEPHQESISSRDSAEPTTASTARKPSAWNYVGIGAGAFMLLFLFLPKALNGTLANQYYLGGAFWAGVIIWCSMNLAKAKK